MSIGRNPPEAISHRCSFSSAENRLHCGGRRLNAEPDFRLVAAPTLSVRTGAYRHPIHTGSLKLAAA
jgi:hypothetical protein